MDPIWNTKNCWALNFYPFRLMLPDEETTVFAAENIPSLLRQA